MPGPGAEQPGLQTATSSSSRACSRRPRSFESTRRSAHRRRHNARAGGNHAPVAADPPRRSALSGNGEVSEWDKGTCGSRPSAASPGRSCCAAATTPACADWTPPLHPRWDAYGVRFDLDRLEVTSPPVPIIESVVATQELEARNIQSRRTARLRMCRATPPAWITECTGYCPMAGRRR